MTTVHTKGRQPTKPLVTTEITLITAPRFIDSLVDMLQSCVHTNQDSLLHNNITKYY